jgi:hypothetical protein
VIHGSFLCGSITYRAEKLAGPIGHCHCRTCRKAHSAAFATTARVDREDFQWTRGQDLLSHFESSPGKLRHFCSRCETQLLAEWVDQSSVILRMGSADTDPGETPQGHIWVSHRASWLRYGPDLPHFSEGVGSPLLEKLEGESAGDTNWQSE